MNINQGEIWEVEFFPNIGSEIGKIRPAIVVSSNLIGKLPLKTIVPITNWSNSFENYPWIYKIFPNSENGLYKLSGADCFQIRNFSVKRFHKKIGSVSEEEIFKVHEIILKTLNPKYRIL